MMNAAPTPVPIEEIAGLWDYFPYPIWAVGILGLAVLSVLMGLIWLVAFRKGSKAELTARERARMELSHAAAEVDEMDPYLFGIRISDTLRVFIESETGLHATTRTSMEFLSEMRESPVFSPDEKAALSLFLERADLIKFARAHATAADSRQLLESAERIVASTRPAQERDAK